MFSVFKKNRLIDQFAQNLADEFYSQVLPAITRNYLLSSSSSTQKNKKQLEKQNKKVKDQLNDTILQVNQFRQTNKLGTYGKARLHMTFTERLIDLGYDEATAKEVNKILLLQTP